MPTTTLNRGTVWGLEYGTIYSDGRSSHIGHWKQDLWNEREYGAVAVEYTTPTISDRMESRTVTIPVSFIVFQRAAVLYASLSTRAPDSSGYWRFGPTAEVVSNEVQFNNNTQSIELTINDLVWISGQKIYLYLYDKNNGTGTTYDINAVQFGSAGNATLSYSDAYTLSTLAGNGSSITVARQSSSYVETGEIANGALLYTNDTLRITATPAQNYRIVQLTVNGAVFQSGGSYTVSGNVIVESEAQVLASDVGATNADIESASTITIARYDNNYVHSLHYSFGNLSGYITAAGGISNSEVKISGTSVAFTVPSSFYAEIPNATSGTCTITCRTYASTDSLTVLGDPTSCTFTVTASPSLCSPIVSGTVADTNQTTILLTGDSSKLVRYLSTALCTISTNARNGASIVSKSICGATVSGDTITISGDDLTMQAVRFSATDSRGYTSISDVAIDLLPYTKLTCNPEVARTTPTGGGVSLNLTGMMYTGNWRSGVNNILTIRYRYRESSTLIFSDWRTINSGITQQSSGYKTMSSISLLDSNGSDTGFDYQHSYVFEFEAKDGDGSTDCMIVTRQVTVQRGIPVFDWGENDFRFNVPVYLGEKPVASVPMGHVDATSTSTVFTATVDGITELKDGVWCYLTNGVVTSAKNCTLNINNLGAKPLYGSMAAATRSTTIFNINYTMLFIYNETRVEGGCWDVFYGYNSDTNTIAYNIRDYQSNKVMKSALYRYMFCFTALDGTLIPSCGTSNSTSTSKTLTTESFDPFAPIYYYTTTTTVVADASPGASYMYTKYYDCNMRYAWNVSSTQLTAKEPVYIKCSPQTNGTVKLAGDDCIVQSLPTSADGYVYIFLGYAHSAYQIELSFTHPVYCYREGCIQLWTGVQIELDTIKGQLSQLLSAT